MLSEFMDGGPWMYPVAGIGLAGLGLGVANALTRRVMTTVSILTLIACVLVGMLGTYFGMVRALDYIAAGPDAARKFYLPLNIAAVGLLPAYFAIIMAAIGSAILGVTAAYRVRQHRRRAIVVLADGLATSMLLTCFMILTYAVPEMLMAAVDANEPMDAMAKGLASSVKNVVWPALLAFVLLAIRVGISIRKQETVG